MLVKDARMQGVQQLTMEVAPELLLVCGHDGRGYSLSEGANSKSLDLPDMVLPCSMLRRSVQ